MRNMKFTKLLSVILAAVLLLGSFASVLSFAEDDAADEPVQEEAAVGVEIISKNLNYASRTEIVYAVEANGVKKTDSVVMLFWNEAQAEDGYTYEKALYRKSFYGRDTIMEVEGCYLFSSRGIAPKDINSSIYARPVIRHVDIVDGEAVVTYTYGDVLKYNVGMYAAEKLAETDNSEAQNKLYTGLIEYAEAAGAKFGASEPDYVLAKIEDAQGSFGNFGAKYAIADADGKLMLRADAVNAEGKYFIKWTDAEGNDLSTSRIAKVAAPTEAGTHVYTPVWGEAADSAYAGTTVIEKYSTGPIYTGAVNTKNAPTTDCYDGSGIKRWTGNKTYDTIKYNFSAIPKYTKAEDGTVTYETGANGFYVEDKRDNYYIAEDLSGNKKIYAERSQKGAGWTVGFNNTTATKTETMYTEVDLTFDELTANGVQIHVNATVYDAAGTNVALRTNLYTRVNEKLEDGTFVDRNNGYLYTEGNNSAHIGIDGETTYFGAHGGETITLGIRLVKKDVTTETTDENGETTTTTTQAAYFEYYLNGEYAGEFECAKIKSYKANLDVSSLYIGYMSVNTVTACADDVIIDNVMFSK